jgi:hypothetical protein
MNNFIYKFDSNVVQSILNRGVSMSNKVKITVDEVFRFSDMEKRKKRLEEILIKIIKNSAPIK